MHRQFWDRTHIVVSKPFDPQWSDSGSFVYTSCSTCESCSDFERTEREDPDMWLRLRQFCNFWTSKEHRMLQTTFWVLDWVWVKIWPVCVMEENRGAIAPSKPDFERKCALVYHLKDHALQVTGLEKKTQDISRPFLHFGRRSRHMHYFSLYLDTDLCWGHRLKNFWADLNREYLELENGSKRHAIHVFVFWGLRIEDMFR